MAPGGRAAVPSGKQPHEGDSILVFEEEDPADSPAAPAPAKPRSQPAGGPSILGPAVELPFSFGSSPSSSLNTPLDSSPRCPQLSRQAHAMLLHTQSQKVRSSASTSLAAGASPAPPAATPPMLAHHQSFQYRRHRNSSCLGTVAGAEPAEACSPEAGGRSSVSPRRHSHGQPVTSPLQGLVHPRARAGAAGGRASTSADGINSSGAAAAAAATAAAAAAGASGQGKRRSATSSLQLLAALAGLGPEATQRLMRLPGRNRPASYTQKRASNDSSTSTSGPASPSWQAVQQISLLQGRLPRSRLVPSQQEPQQLLQGQGVDSASRRASWQDGELGPLAPRPGSSGDFPTAALARKLQAPASQDALEAQEGSQSRENPQSAPSLESASEADVCWPIPSSPTRSSKHRVSGGGRDSQPTAGAGSESGLSENRCGHSVQDALETIAAARAHLACGNIAAALRGGNGSFVSSSTSMNQALMPRSVTLASFSQRRGSQQLSASGNPSVGSAAAASADSNVQQPGPGPRALRVQGQVQAAAAAVVGATVQRTESLTEGSDAIAAAAAAGGGGSLQEAQRAEDTGAEVGCWVQQQQQQQQQGLQQAYPPISLSTGGEAGTVPGKPSLQQRA